MKKVISYFGFVLIIFAGVGLVYGSTVADVAKKEKERRAKLKDAKDTKDATKVFTNQDIADFKAKNKDKFGEEGEGEAQEAETEVKEDASKEKEEEDLKYNESYWRGKFQETSGKVTELQTRLDQMQSDYNALSRNSGISDSQLTGELGAQREQMDKVKQDLEAAKAAVEQLEEEARKSGAPPGWVRE